MVENLSANAGDARDTGSVPGLRKSSGAGNGNLLQYSCLEKFCGQRNWVGYGPQDHKKLDMIEQLTHNGNGPKQRYTEFLYFNKNYS